MTPNSSNRWFVFLPCSRQESWVVPQNCLAEIVTLKAEDEQPPDTLEWRGVQVSVMDFGGENDEPWREARHGTGIIAVFLGLKDEGCDYWGVAIRGQGLSIENISDEQLQAAEQVTPLPHASAAFCLRGATYQVPDLLSLQRRIAAASAAA